MYEAEEVVQVWNIPKISPEFGRKFSKMQIFFLFFFIFVLLPSLPPQKIRKVNAEKNSMTKKSLVGLIDHWLTERFLSHVAFDYVEESAFFG